MCDVNSAPTIDLLTEVFILWLSYMDWSSKAICQCVLSL